MDASCSTRTIRRHLNNEKIKHKKRIHRPKLIYLGSPRSVVTNLLHWDEYTSSNPRLAITFTFGVMLLGKLWNSCYFKFYNYCFTTRMALSLNNPPRLICHWTKKPNLSIYLSIYLTEWNKREDNLEHDYLPCQWKSYVLIRNTTEVLLASLNITWKLYFIYAGTVRLLYIMAYQPLWFI